MSKLVLNDNQETLLKNIQIENNAKKKKHGNFDQKIHCFYSTNSKNKGFVDLSKSTCVTDEKVLQIYNDVIITGLK